MDACCEPTTHGHKKKFDWLLWFSLILVVAGYVGPFLPFPTPQWLDLYASSVYELMNKMWIGLSLGIVFVGLLQQIPQEFIMSVLGKPYTIRGLIYATIAGVLLDMCSHGILLVGMKLYKRGASIGQIMASLISSPWNSLSLTIILISLIGLKFTLMFILLSMVVAFISGLIFDQLVLSNLLPQNPNEIEIPENFSFFAEAKQGLKSKKFNLQFFNTVLTDGFKDSKMILKWVLFGVVLTSIIRVVVPHDTFATLLSPSLKGLAWTLLFASVIEICSEGATPMAADIIQRAHALGNGFTFLMAGVSTNYSEIMSLKETTGSWKIALYLPLVTLPQVLLLGYFLNHFH